jgi:uncharacterized protein
MRAMPGPNQRPPRRTPRCAGRAAPPPRAAAAQPLGERELDELQALLDRVPAPLEPLDVGMLDGYLCGVLLQPRSVPDARWLPFVTDVDGRALPGHFDAERLHALVLRRHAELADAIARRQWFDPWVFELTDDDPANEPAEAAADRDDPAGDDDDVDDAEPAAVEAVYPWVAGFATAQEHFPGLMALDAQALTEPLALIYRHLAADDLEDADELLAEIDSLEPPADLSEAVEGLVRACLLLADVARPLAAPPAATPQGARAAHRPARRRGPSDR